MGRTPDHSGIGPQALRAIACLLLLGGGLVAANARGEGSHGGEGQLDSTVISYFHDAVFVHGMPYEDAGRFGPKALPTLRFLLTDNEYRPNWGYVVTAIAFIGEPGGFEILREFLMDRFKGEVDGDTFSALIVAPSVLGIIHDPRVTAYLVRAVEPTSWRGIRWSFESYRDSNLRLLLSEQAITGLSYTGTDQARKVLERLDANPLSPTHLTTIRSGIARNEKIASIGLERYVKELAAARH